MAPILTFIGAGIVAWAALAQAKTARRRHEEQTKADRERRITESFAKAVEQLGDDKLEVRLGGIYTLERLSRESEREYGPIMETLTAYVREHAPWPPRQANQEKELELRRIQPATDVQAILTVLGRREEGRRAQEGKNQRLDLSATDLRGADLRGAHLEHTNLGIAHLEGAWLWEAHLEGAFLIRAHLEGALLQKSYFENAGLWGVCLKGADLEGADFFGAHLEGADLEGAKHLTQDQINSAFGNENTTLPKGLERPAHWIERQRPG